jgi:outer membrane protein, heavy metal efflux system
VKTKIVFVLYLILIGLSAAGQSSAELNQDTIYVNIPEAEQRFVSKNLTLLINKYNVDMARANYLNAKLWYNPNIYYGTTLYNVETHKWFSDYYPQQNDFDETWQLQQLLTLAGRHSATWKLALEGVNQAIFQLADILRNLKYELYTDISDLYFNQQQVKMYQYEEVQMQHLLDVTKELYKHGNASGNDVIQLQQQLQDAVAQEVISLQSVYNDEQDMKILLCYPAKTYFVVKELPQVKTDFPTYESIVDTAIRNRPDLKLAESGVKYNELNIKLQRATAMPDITLGITYTGSNAVAAEYEGIYASMDLPTFNRNQWGIKGAKEGKAQAEAQDSLTLSTVQNEVTNAYCTLILADRKIKVIDPEYGKNLDEMMANAVKNYECRNIDMLQLLSLIGTYNDGKTNLLNLYVQYYNAVHNLNLNTGIEIIK